LKNKFLEFVLEFPDIVPWIFLEACVPSNVLLVPLFDHLAPLTVPGTPTPHASVTQERHRMVVTLVQDPMELLETELLKLVVVLEVAVVATTGKMEEEAKSVVEVVEVMEVEVETMEVEVETTEVEVETMEDQVGAMVVEIEMEIEEIQVEIRVTDVMEAQVETATNNLAPTLTKVKQETEMEEEAVEEEEEESVLEMFWRLVLMFVLDFQLVFSQLVWVDVPNDALAKNRLEKKIFATIQNCTFPF